MTVGTTPVGCDAWGLSGKAWNGKSGMSLRRGGGRRIGVARTSHHHPQRPHRPAPISLTAWKSECKSSLGGFAGGVRPAFSAMAGEETLPSQSISRPINFWASGRFPTEQLTEPPRRQGHQGKEKRNWSSKRTKVTKERWELIPIAASAPVCGQQHSTQEILPHPTRATRQSRGRFRPSGLDGRGGREWSSRDRRLEDGTSWRGCLPGWWAGL